jgi:hypothetical protein
MSRFGRLFSVFALVMSTSLYSIDAFVEARGAYFYPLDHRLREVYATGLGLFGLELSCQAYEGLYPWISADIFHKKGHSTGIHYSTKITAVPLGLGLKYLFPVNFVDIYLGGGILGTYMYIKDGDPFVVHTTAKWGVGAIAKTGAIFNINKHLLIDLFTSYSYTKIGIDHRPGVITHDADLSGLAFGCAIGYRFGSCRPNNRSCDQPCSEPKKPLRARKWLPSNYRKKNSPQPPWNRKSNGPFDGD